ncbi:replication protein A 32 kDa subunit-like [Actinia tenebrosa]|uniref:Replication protein A 32 kDa subunit-like n=1 Tax=Actinia tenebrosa TaxID=6105 RepID=A0A6P8ISI1_ACTTE|nr:replication protein A 32 kDa subunit-like [Actinia tenebrosa]
MWNDGGFGGGYESMDTSGQFGGGGYMQDNQFASPTSSSQEKKRSSSKAQSVIPCTIKQLNSAIYDRANDVFKLPYTDLIQVTFVGVIRSAQESSTNIVYTVNDMTGEDIVVKKWVNENEESDEERERRSACRENTYVQVTGNLKSFQENSRSVIAFNLVPITDFNQLTHHTLEVVHAHLVLQKEPEICGNTPGVGMTPGKGGYQGGTMINTPGKMETSGFGGSALGLSGVKLQVHELISSTNSEEGMGLATIRQRLRAVPEMQIRNAIEFLSNEGHIYTTVDDEHYRSTDSG